MGEGLSGCGFYCFGFARVFERFDAEDDEGEAEDTHDELANDGGRGAFFDQLGDAHAEATEQAEQADEGCHVHHVHAERFFRRQQAHDDQDDAEAGGDQGGFVFHAGRHVENDAEQGEENAEEDGMVFHR